MAHFRDFYHVLREINIPDSTQVCELAVPRKRYSRQPETSLRQLSQASTDGCPTCRLNSQALLVCLLEVQSILQDPLSLEYISISPERIRSNDADSAVSYHVSSNGLIQVTSPSGLNVFESNESEVLSGLRARSSPASYISSNVALTQVKQWLQFCVAIHTVCRPGQPHALPRRVLDVQTFEARLPVRLNNELDHHICLSHS
jgi:hypothetical protein